MRTLRTALALLCAMLLAVGVAACGDDDDNGGGGNDERAVGAQTGTPAEEARAAAEEDAEQPVELPRRTLGFLQFTNEAEIAVRMQNAAEQAAKAIGWDFVACDGQGDPRRQGQCGSTLLDRGADVIIANTISPASSRRALREADRQDIPWFVIGGVVEDDPLIDANYSPDDSAMSQLLVDWLAEERGDEDTSIALINQFPGIVSLGQRADAVKEGLEAHPNLEIVGEEELDYTNVVQSVQRQVSQQIQQNQNLDVLWSTTNDMPPVAQTVRSRGLTGDRKPMILGYFADLANLALIRDDQAEALAEWPIEGDIWAGVDQAAQMVARDEEPPADRDALVQEYSLNFIEPLLVTKENLPPEGEYPAPNGDFVTYFQTKWEQEFESGGGGS